MRTYENIMDSTIRKFNTTIVEIIPMHLTLSNIKKFLNIVLRRPTKLKSKHVRRNKNSNNRRKITY